MSETKFNPEKIATDAVESVLKEHLGMETVALDAVLEKLIATAADRMGMLMDVEVTVDNALKDIPGCQAPLIRIETPEFTAARTVADLIQVIANALRAAVRADE